VTLITYLLFSEHSTAAESKPAYFKLLFCVIYFFYASTKASAKPKLRTAAHGKYSEGRTYITAASTSSTPTAAYTICGSGGGSGNTVRKSAKHACTGTSFKFADDATSATADCNSTDFVKSFPLGPVSTFNIYL